MARDIQTPGQTAQAAETPQDDAQGTPEQTHDTDAQSVVETPTDANGELLVALLANQKRIESKLDQIIEQAGVKIKAKPKRFKLVPGKGHVLED